jgi:hypothetical protein
MGGHRPGKVRKSDAIQPATGKTPRVPPEFQGASDHLSPAWRFKRADSGWKCAWKDLPHADVHGILQQLSSAEGMSWAEHGRHGSHNVEIFKLAPEARGRLKQLRLDDLEALYSLRLTGKNRVWGVRDHHILRVMWWDPDHDICPSAKKNT